MDSKYSWHLPQTTAAAPINACATKNTKDKIANVLFRAHVYNISRTKYKGE